MIKTAIVLAGGFGTRLQKVVKDLPKPMADVAGEPFLAYVLRYLKKQGIQRAILSVGYKSEAIQNYFGDSFSGVQLEYSIELEPLGTGGAILKAVNHGNEDEFFVLNGDTMFNINLRVFYSKHKAAESLLSLALKRMTNFDRYGVVNVNSSNRVVSFEEKKNYREGNINGGIYLLQRKAFDDLNLLEKFSFEKDFMEKYYNSIPVFGFDFDDYFIDIGIPEDYERAKSELKQLGD